MLLIGWINHVARPIRSTTQIWVVMCHLYGISVLVSQQHLARKPVVVSPNVCFFLRLKPKQNFRKSKKDTCKHCDQILIFQCHNTIYCIQKNNVSVLTGTDTPLVLKLVEIYTKSDLYYKHPYKINILVSLFY